MRRAALVVIVAATLVAAVTYGRAAAGEPPPSGGVLAFTTLEEIHTVDVDRGGFRRLASHTVGFGAWSPDGREFAFLRYRDDAYSDLDVVAANGTGKRRLARFAAPAGDPAWSPDGRLVAFNRCTGRPHWRGTLCAVWVIAPDGTGARRVTPHGMFGELAWSPDSRTIAIAIHAWEVKRFGIFLADVDGGPPRRLTRKDDASVAWSPDGRRLAFARSSPSGHTVAAVIGADGRGLHRISPALGEFADLAWSPDGTAVAYAGSDPDVEACGDDAYAIYRVSPDGTRRRRITPYRAFTLLPKWSPDGTRIAYELFRCSDERRNRPGFRIAVTDADGTGGHAVLSEACATWGLAWQPALVRRPPATAPLGQENKNL